MTVIDFWKIVDHAGCGTKIGADELVSPGASRRDTYIDPWNPGKQSVVEKNSRPQTLAVDLSIWICEALTSQAMGDNHNNPTMFLVFSRAVKLLSLGLKLVFIVEGKKRCDNDKLRKRRSGGPFWRACEQCETMLQRLGAIVVRAKIEAEALCALLNERGIVDGVISNDGDCFLFGAKVLYAKFSVENLDNSSVVRYQASDLKAVIERNDQSAKTIQLTRKDLIAFSILTGSDIVGTGFTNVGGKKALRFIAKSKEDRPLQPSDAAIQELYAWERAALHYTAGAGVEKEKAPGKHCSCCGHPGTKSQHAKHGCTGCGTQEGESCYLQTSDDKFRKKMRLQALEMGPMFNTSKAVEAYMDPNGSQLPLRLATATASTIAMKMPDLEGLVELKFASTDYITKSAGKVMSTLVLDAQTESNNDAQALQRRSGGKKRQCPKPTGITKSVLHKGVPSVEVLWRVKATLTDEYGEGIDGYEYSTIEALALMQENFPRLVKTFHESEKQAKKQGDAQVARRLQFLAEVLPGAKGNKQSSPSPKRTKVCNKSRRRFLFTRTNAQMASRKSGRDARAMSSDLLMLAQQRTGRVMANAHRQCLFGNRKLNQRPHVHDVEPEKREAAATPETEESSHAHNSGSPDNNDTASEPLLCEMGDVLIPVSPIAVRRKPFPPAHIWVTQHQSPSPSCGVIHSD